jgi:hypothetical protein
MAAKPMVDLLLAVVISIVIWRKDTTFGFRAIAIGPRIYDYDYDTYGIRAGLEGSFDFGGNNYFWSAGMQLNDAQYDSKLI